MATITVRTMEGEVVAHYTQTAWEGPDAFFFAEGLMRAMRARENRLVPTIVFRSGS